jgi:N-acetylmuramoyl-L-alanine amidase
MNARVLIVIPCGLAIAVSLAAASVVAAHEGLPSESASPAEVATLAPPKATPPPEATPTPVPPNSVEAEIAATATAPPRVLPVPAEALPATDAQVLAGPGTLLQEGPTPRPHRATVVLDPGHGRGDPGAVHHTSDGQVDLTEAEANLDIAEKLQTFLEAKGYDVYVTRSGFGKPLSPGPLTQPLISRDLMDRVRLATAVNGDVFISIHNNGSSNPAQSGTEVWYCGQPRFGSVSARLAKLVFDAAVLGLKDYGYNTVPRGTQEDSTVHDSPGFCQFLVTREVQMPAVLTETLFLTNDADAAVLKDPAAREAVADRVAQAIDTFLRERGLSPEQPN